VRRIEVSTAQTRTVFGEVLAELMESRGIEATEENVAALADKAGADAFRLKLRMRGEYMDVVGGLAGLADELSLDERERTVLALAYAMEERTSR
jgi:hypothetical protein